MELFIVRKELMPFEQPLWARHLPTMSAALFAKYYYLFLQRKRLRVREVRDWIQGT